MIKTAAITILSFAVLLLADTPTIVTVTNKSKLRIDILYRGKDSQKWLDVGVVEPGKSSVQKIGAADFTTVFRVFLDDATAIDFDLESNLSEIEKKLAMSGESISLKLKPSSFRQHVKDEWLSQSIDPDNVEPIELMASIVDKGLSLAYDPPRPPKRPKKKGC